MKYRAYYIPIGSTLRCGIIGVLANSMDDALERIEQELKKPGRHTYLQQWEDSGRIVEHLDEEEANAHPS